MDNKYTPAMRIKLFQLARLVFNRRAAGAVAGMLLHLLLLVGTEAVRLLRRDLPAYPRARCNDGTVAAYYHHQVNST